MSGNGTLARRSENPAVSLVIPVYNGGEFLARSLSRIGSFLSRHQLDAEVVVVDDGSTDETPALLSGITDPRFEVLRLPSNRGKYGALKVGMVAARGDCRAFTDADIPYELEAIPYMAALLTSGGFHIVVGDRTLSDSATVSGQALLRRFSTRAFSFAVRMLVTGELFDTQVGFKAFRGDVASALFPLITDDGFAGDVELLYIALKYNLAIRRIPVRLRRSGPSTVSVFGHSLPMLRRISGLRRRWARGTYDSEQLRIIADQRYWTDDDDGE